MLRVIVAGAALLLGCASMPPDADMEVGLISRIDFERGSLRGIAHTEDAGMAEIVAVISGGSGASAWSHWRATSAPAEDPADSTTYPTPGLEVSSPVFFDSTGGISGSRISLVRGVDEDWSVLQARDWRGASVTLYRWGALSDGRYLEYDSREVWGIPSQVALRGVGRSTTRIELPLTLDFDGWGKVLGGHFLGLGDSAVFDGSTSTATAGGVWQPGGQFHIQFRWWPEQKDAPNRDRVLDLGSVRIEFDDPYPAVTGEGPQVQIHVEVDTVSDGTKSATFFDEFPYNLDHSIWIDLDFDKDNGIELLVEGVDEVGESLFTSSNPATASAAVIGGAAAFGRLEELRFFDQSFRGDADVIAELRSGPLDDLPSAVSRFGLARYYPGRISTGDLLEFVHYDESTGSSTYDATGTALVVGRSLEGGGVDFEDVTDAADPGPLAGNPRGVALGSFRNARAVPTSPDGRYRRFAGHGSQAVTAIRADGATVTIGATYVSYDDFVNSAPASGSATVFLPQSALKLHADVEGVVTVDGFGWTGSLPAPLSYRATAQATQSIDFTGLTTSATGANDWWASFYLTPSPDLASEAVAVGHSDQSEVGAFQIRFDPDAGAWSARVRDTSGVVTLISRDISSGTTSELPRRHFPRPAFVDLFCTWGSTVELWIDGIQADTASVGSGPASGPTTTVRAFEDVAALGTLFQGHISRFRFSDELPTMPATLRARMFDAFPYPTSPGVDSLRHWEESGYVVDEAVNKWRTTGDATHTDVDRGFGTARATVLHLAAELIRYATGSLPAIDDDAWALGAREARYVSRQGETAWELLQIVLDGTGLAAVPTSAGGWRIKAIPWDLDAATPVGKITGAMIQSAEAPEKVDDLAASVAVSYGQLERQTDLISTADDKLRQELTAARRYAVIGSQGTKARLVTDDGRRRAEVADRVYAGVFRHAPDARDLARDFWDNVHSGIHGETPLGVTHVGDPTTGQSVEVTRWDVVEVEDDHGRIEAGNYRVEAVSPRVDGLDLLLWR